MVFVAITSEGLAEALRRAADDDAIWCGSEEGLWRTESGRRAHCRVVDFQTCLKPLRPSLPVRLVVSRPRCGQSCS
jgi:hypothetical protein